MAEYFTHISEGSGDKTGALVLAIGAFTSGFIISIIAHPYLALAYLGYLPFTIFTFFSLVKRLMPKIMAKFKMSAQLGGFTEELLSSLKLIISFGKEDLKIQEYRALSK